MTPCQPCRGLSRATHVLHRPFAGAVEPVCSEHARNAVRELTPGEWVTVRAFPTPTPDLSRVTVWPSQLDDADTADVPEWVRDCTHDPVCGLESECRDLQREEAAADRAEEKRDERD